MHDNSVGGDDTLIGGRETLASTASSATAPEMLDNSAAGNDTLIGGIHQW